MVLWAGHSVSRGRRLVSGRIAYELVLKCRRGRAYRALVVPSDERVLCLRRNKRASQLDDGYLDGIVLGIVDDTNEYLCFVPSLCAVIAAQALRRH